MKTIDALTCAATLALAGPLLAAEPIRISVDAREAPRRIFHARLEIPASEGPLTLLYPKWLPGEHGPTGPIDDLAGLRITAQGKPLAWTRDPLDMVAFRVTVPAGAKSIEVALDFLSPTSTEGFSSGASAGERLAILSWNQLLLYPETREPGSLRALARVRLPSSWKFATALPVASEGPDEVAFQEVSLRTLIDSPITAGVHHRKIPLAPSIEPPHEIDLFADSEDALAMPPDMQKGYDRLVLEAHALFGAHHYSGYRFLWTLSDSIAHFGLEHHESSDNRSAERALIDPDQRRGAIGLLPHEFVHSWNGKFRRPVDLTLDDFHAPADTRLLWVYEGLTSYLGEVLSGRTGLRSPEEERDHLALLAAGLDHTPGRTWRPLQDTATAAQLLFESPDAWQAWRRSVDFYDEGVMLWLEADATIRRESSDARSLDDFCRRFFGGETGTATVKPYTFDDLVTTLSEVARVDWKKFFEDRLGTNDAHAGLRGLEAAGWKVVYDAERGSDLKSREEVRENIDLRFSLGIDIQKDATLIDVVPDLPAAKAGLAPGMKLVAVDGRRFTKDRVRDALRRAKTGKDPIELLVQNGEFYRTVRVDAHDGERYPHLARIEGKPDLLSSILTSIAR